MGQSYRRSRTSSDSQREVTIGSEQFALWYYLHIHLQLVDCNSYAVNSDSVGVCMSRTQAEVTVCVRYVEFVTNCKDYLDCGVMNHGGRCRNKIVHEK